jgi:hypothetical protein
LDLRSFLWYLFLTAALSFKRDSQPELYPSSGESRCFLFFKFQLNPGHPLKQGKISNL